MKNKKLYLIPLIALILTSCKVNSKPSSSASNATSFDQLSASEITSAPSSESNIISSVEPSSSNEVSSSSEAPDTIVNLELFAMNDTHGNVTDTSNGLGISRMSTLLKSYPKDVNNALYISQGDMWQGSAEAGLTFGAIVNDWMNDMHFTSMTIGNHEFDWEVSHLRANAEAANFPYLGINIYSYYTDQRLDFLSPSVVVEKNGAKIGIIGAIGDCYSSISSSLVKDIYFKVGSELTSLVINEANRLRNVEKCDFIIYSVHDGGTTISSNPYDESISDYVDIVFEGHTHDDYRYTDSKGVYTRRYSRYHQYYPEARS